jgi:cytochrome c biogenesis protein CcdA
MAHVAGLLPWAFSAGVVATLNPCGFGVLPAYLGYVVGRTGAGLTTRRNALHGVGVGLAMTGGVLTVFLAAGAVISAVGTAVARALPWLSVGIGAGVVAAGLAMFLWPHWHPGLAIGNPAVRSAPVPRGGYGAFYLFGAGYGVASLGCTLPVFLIVMTQALAAGGFLPGVIVFLAYGLGMGVVLLALSVAAGLGQGILAAGLRGLVPHVRWVGALGMVAAGAYLIYYQLTTSRALLGIGAVIIAAGG